MTASHNPGGPENDFGIKYNQANGGPAPEALTDKIFEISKELKEYHSVNVPMVRFYNSRTHLWQIDLGKIATHTFDGLTIDLIDSVGDYVTLMKEIYDFESIKNFFKTNPSFKVLFDGMHGGLFFSTIHNQVTGPYAERVFVQELGLPESSIMNCVPLEDFGGGHPDPNLTVNLLFY